MSKLLFIPNQDVVASDTRTDIYVKIGERRVRVCFYKDGDVRIDRLGDENAIIPEGLQATVGSLISIFAQERDAKLTIEKYNRRVSHSDDSMAEKIYLIDKIEKDFEPESGLGIGWANARVLDSDVRWNTRTMLDAPISVLKDFIDGKL
jgi:hypothetical protein